MIRAGWSILVSDFEQRKLALVAAALIGLLPPVAPLLPGMAPHQASQVSQSALLLVLVLILLTWPCGLGSSLISRDLSEKRLSFHFARPIPGVLLWTAKLAAALLLYFASLFLALAPSLALDPSLMEAVFEHRDEGSPAPLLATPETMIYSVVQPGLEPSNWPAEGPALLALALLYLMVVHTVSTFLRLRTVWLLLDLLAAALLIAALWWVRHLCLSHQAYGPLLLIERLGLFATTLIFFAAGARQLSEGRSDPLRSRWVLSTTLWPGLATLLLTALLYASWAVRPSLDDLEAVLVSYADPAGPHLVVGGPVANRAGHQATFLTDLETGDSEYLGSLPVTADFVRFSADGSRVVWPRCRRLAPIDCQLWTRDLRADTPARATAIYSGPWSGQALELSRSGDLVLVAQWKQVSVYALSTGRLVAALRIEGVVDTRFLSAHRVLIAQHQAEDTALSIWNLEDRRREPLVDLPGRWSGIQRLDPRRKILLYRSLVPRIQRLIDLETGRLIFDVGEQLGHLGLLYDARFLDDGRLAMVFASEPPEESKIPVAEPYDATLVVLDPLVPSGWRSVTLEQVGSLRLGPELARNRALLGVQAKDARGVEAPAFMERLGVEALEDSSTWILHVGPPDSEAPLTLEAVAGGLRPPRLRGLMPRIGSPAAQLFIAKADATFRWSPDGGEPELVLPPFR